MVYEGLRPLLCDTHTIAEDRDSQPDGGRSLKKTLQVRVNHRFTASPECRVNTCVGKFLQDLDLTIRGEFEMRDVSLIFYP